MKNTVIKKPISKQNYRCSTLLGLALYSLLSITFNAQAKEKDEWDVNNPPGEEYKINIEVNQGTWMNVDVSPNGKQIVFDLLGDLYLMPIEGGEATALTTSIAWEMQPQFSPDGSHIAFTSDAGGGDNIWVMDLNSKESRQVTKESFRLLNSPTWSPDGNYIAARKHFTSRRSLGAGEIWLYHIAGGKGIQLNKRPNDQKDLGEPAFSADGKKVLFSRDSTPGRIFEYSKDSNRVIYEIFSIDRTSGDIKREISGYGGSVRPTPSPDGKFIAFVRRIRNQSSIFIKDLTTGEEYPVYQKLDRDMQETWAIHGVYPTLAWTPDSNEIVFWAGGKIHRLNRVTQVASEIPFKVNTSKSMRKAVQFANNPYSDSFNAQMLRWVTVNPNGKQVVFQALGKLYVQDLPNGKPKRLTRANNEMEFSPSFSKDGKWVVYTTWNDKKQGAVKKVRVRGGRSQAITMEPGKYLSPAFSRDNEHVVFQKLFGSSILDPAYSLNSGIYTISAKGKNLTKVSDSGALPFYSKENNRIYFTQIGGKESQLVSVNLQGLDKQTHASAGFTTEFSLSPNESLIAFKQRYHLYVAPYTKAGKPLVLSNKSDKLPTIRVSNEGGNYLSWSMQGKKLNWSLGNQLNSLEIPNILDWNNDYADLDVKKYKLKLTVESDKPKGNTLLSGAKVITMEGDLVYEQGDILISGNRIKAVGAMGSLEVPGNALTVDLKGKTVIPGLVDVHWHGRQGASQITPQQNWYNLATLAFGVTTIHDPSNNTAEIFSASELAKAGEIIAPRIFSTGRILYGATAHSTAKVNDLTDAKEHLLRLKSQGAFSVKSYNQPRRDQRQQVLQAARESEILVMPEGGSTFQHNLTMIVDGHTGIEHAIPPAAIYDDVKQLWSQSQTAYTPTLVVAYGGIWGENYWYQHSQVWKHPLLSRYVPKAVLYPRSIRRPMAPEEDYNHFKVASVAADLQDLGVKVQLGAHGQREGLGAHWEMWMFAQGGMTPMEVLKASTIDGAIYLGMQEHIGSIKAGKLADIAILDTDPLSNIYETDKVSMVMINGRLYDSKTMNEIGNHPKTRQKLYFE